MICFWIIQFYSSKIPAWFLIWCRIKSLQGPTSSEEKHQYKFGYMIIININRNYIVCSPLKILQ
jgi:hypothetical protein